MEKNSPSTQGTSGGYSPIASNVSGRNINPPPRYPNGDRSFEAITKGIASVEMSYKGYGGGAASVEDQTKSIQERIDVERGNPGSGGPVGGRTYVVNNGQRHSLNATVHLKTRMVTPNILPTFSYLSTENKYTFTKTLLGGKVVYKGDDDTFLTIFSSMSRSECNLVCSTLNVAYNRGAQDQYVMDCEVVRQKLSYSTDLPDVDPTKAPGAADSEVTLKYHVYPVDASVPASGNYYVFDMGKDTYAKYALNAYALAIAKVNPTLSLSILNRYKLNTFDPWKINESISQDEINEVFPIMDEAGELDLEKLQMARNLIQLCEQKYLEKMTQGYIEAKTEG